MMNHCCWYEFAIVIVCIEIYIHVMCEYIFLCQSPSFCLVECSACLVPSVLIVVLISFLLLLPSDLLNAFTCCTGWNSFPTFAASFINWHCITSFYWTTRDSNPGLFIGYKPTALPAELVVLKFMYEKSTRRCLILYII